MKIMLNKHSATRTVVEHAADRSPVFRSFKTLIKSITRDDFPAIGLQKSIHNEFTWMKNEGILRLSPTKEGVLKYFIACYPATIGNAAPTASVGKGFLYNGMLDESTTLWPDVHNIISTCKSKSISKDQELLVHKKTRLLYSECPNR